MLRIESDSVPLFFKLSKCIKRLSVTLRERGEGVLVGFSKVLTRLAREPLEVVR